MLLSVWEPWEVWDKPSCAADCETDGMLQLKITCWHDLTSAIQLKDIREHRLNNCRQENNSVHVMFIAKNVVKWL